MGATGSVAWMFERKGIIRAIPPAGLTKLTDELELKLIDAGAEDIGSDGEIITITCAPHGLQKLRLAIEGIKLTIDEIGFEWIANNSVAITDPVIQEQIAEFLGALEDMDDVTQVYTNAVI